MAKVYADLLDIVFKEAEWRCAKAAKLHKALEIAQAPRGEEHDLVLFRRQKFLHGSNVE